MALEAGKTVFMPGMWYFQFRLFRDRIPVIVDEVTTLCGPGELIDVIILKEVIAY